MPWTIFDYRYRDAGNFKTAGSVALEGLVNERLVASALSALEAGEFFIAEQLGIPPLYAGLYRRSGGPTADDHCWHEFVGLRHVDASDVPPGTPDGGLAELFFARLAAVSEWQGEMSPHWTIA